MIKKYLTKKNSKIKCKILKSLFNENYTQYKYFNNKFEKVDKYKLNHNDLNVLIKKWNIIKGNFYFFKYKI